MRYCTSLFAAALLAGLLAAPASAGPFSDVPTDHWAYDAIDMLQSEGIVEGYPDGTFKGNRSFTRYEMAMVVARLYTRLNQPEMAPGVSQEQFDEYKSLVDALMDEFRAELEELQDQIDGLSGRVDDLEDRVSALERMKDSIEWSGMLRMRVEDVITGQLNGFNLTPGNPSTIPGPTPGQGIGASAEFEEMVLLAAEASPSDYLDVYVDLWQVSSDLNTPVGDVGATASPPNQSLVLDQAYAVADMNTLLGWDDGVFSWLQNVDVVVGRQYNVFGTFGLTYDNGFESRPAFFIDARDPRWEAQLMVARDVNAVNGGQDGLGVARLSYGFGGSHREDSDRTEFARLGLNYLFTGVGAEEGWSVDLDTELASGNWLSGLKLEWYNASNDQWGNDVEETFGADLETSVIVGLDVYNDGNLMVNVRGASIGLPPGYSSVDNNPFEENDALANGIGLAGLPNFNFGYESGMNYFPANFEGFGFTVQYTWFEKFFMDLTAYDGQLKSNEADLPAVIRWNARYPLSDNSDLGLEYIHAGIDVAQTVGKLRGEYLVRF
jgi:hypothetical protein